MNARATTITRRIARLERRAVYNPSPAITRAVARLWRAHHAAIVEG